MAWKAVRKRVHLLDEIRGLCILLMVVYHGAYDLIYLFGVDIPAFHWPFIARFAQPFVAGIFIFISGVACRLSRNNLRRGAVALAFGLAITLFTVLFMPGQEILFGILHFLGLNMILFGLLRPLLDKCPVWPVIAVCAVLLLLTSRIPYGGGVFGFPGTRGVAIPAGWYTHRWLLVLGIGGFGADYFPLLPWIFVFFTGTMAGKYIVAARLPQVFCRPHLGWLAFVGRHTLIVYVLHQPVVYGILWLFFHIVRGG